MDSNKIQEIINEYSNGKSISQLLLDYPNYNRRKIIKILTDNNITIRGGRSKKRFLKSKFLKLK